MSDSAAARLCRARLASLGDHADAESLADVLQLAWALRRTIEPSTTEPADATAPAASPDDTPATSPATPSTPTASAAPTDATRGPDRTRLFPAGAVASDQPFLAASFVSVPAGEALPQRRELERALKPFKRRLPSRVGVELDATATAEASAERRAVTPVFRPVLERWFDVALLVEHNDSMQVWEDTLVDLQRLIAGHGAFRGVRLWRHAVRDGALTLSTHGGTASPPRVVADPAGRRLCLFFTHGTSDEWRQRPLLEFVAQLGRQCPVAIVQMLPRRAWPHTLLGDAFAELQARTPGTANARLHRHDAFSGRLAPVTDALTLPILTLEPKAVGSWARFVMATRGTDHPAVTLAAVESDLSTAPTGPIHATEPPLPSPRQRLTAFRALASREAWQLLRLLAGVPLTLPVMRLLQMGTAGERAQVHLAEVLLGGLVERVTPVGAAVPADEVEYEFVDGVREALLQSLSADESRRIDDAMQPLDARARAYVEAHAGRAVRDFRALLPDDAGTERLLASARSFLSVSRRLFAMRHGLADEVEDAESSVASSHPPGPETSITAPPPAAPSTPRFLDPSVIEDIARSGADGASEKGGLRSLMIFADDTRQAWLVASERALMFIDDTEENRATGTLLQRRDGWLDVLPVITETRSLKRRTVRFGNADQIAWPYSGSVFRSSAVLRARVHQLLPKDAAPTLRYLQELASDYERTRASDSPGSARTDALTAIANRMRNRLPQPTLDLDLLTRSPSEGNRLVAVMSLSQRFEPALLDWLIERLTAEKAFIAYHVARILQQVMHRLPRKEILRLVRGVATAMRELVASNLMDGGVLQVLGAIVMDFNTRDGGVHEVLGAIVEDMSTEDSAGSIASPTPREPVVPSTSEAPATPSLHAPRRFTIVIASTRQDLADIRQVVEASLSRLGHTFMLPRVPSVYPLKDALDAIDRCDVFVLIVGNRYGHVPSDAVLNPSRKSVVELEYEKAMRLGKPVLVFMRRIDGSSLSLSGDTADIKHFRRLLMARHACASFDGADDLRLQVETAMLQLSNTVEARSPSGSSTPRGPSPDSPDAPAAEATPIRPAVLVAGTGHPEADLPTVVQQTSERLGAALARAGYRLFTGGWPGVDEIVARSFVGELSSSDGPLASRLVQFVVKGKHPSFAGGSVVEVERGRAEYEKPLEDAAFVVLVGGEGGTAKLAEIADRAGHLVLPLADTGGDAAAFHRAVKGKRALTSDHRAKALTAADYDALAHPAPDVVDDLLAILERLSIRRQA